MKETGVHYIWNLETGITDFELPWEKLAAPETKGIRDIWIRQQEQLQGTGLIEKFTARLTREWAIETGVIENLYDIDRGITQSLIERGFSTDLLPHGSTNKPVAYVVNLLEDQKDALEGVFDFVSQRRKLSASYIKELHAALVRSQDFTEGQDPSGRYVQIPLIKGDWKSRPNFPTRNGVKFIYCPPEHVAAEMDRLVAMHLQHMESGVAPEVEAAWLHHRFSQIHPFQDGNGRVSRALASMVLLAAGLFPLVVTRDDKTRYLDTLEKADEGDLSQLVKLISRLQQAEFLKASSLTDNVLTESHTISEAISGLTELSRKKRTSHLGALDNVRPLAKALEAEAQAQFQKLAPDLRPIMQNLREGGDVRVFASSDTGASSPTKLPIHANPEVYQSWITLELAWHRKVRLSYAFYGIGRQLNGSMVCEPILQYYASAEDKSPAEQLPLTTGEFVFFYTEVQDQLLQRFRPWSEDVLVEVLRSLEKYI